MAAKKRFSVYVTESQPDLSGQVPLRLGVGPAAVTRGPRCAPVCLSLWLRGGSLCGTHRLLFAVKSEDQQHFLTRNRRFTSHLLINYFLLFFWVCASYP